MAPLVSILMPAYNAERYIADAIASVQGQSYTHWQLLIGDDHSTDRTLEICERLALDDERISVHVTQRHYGEANSVRHELLAMAVGEWIHELDADDTIAPEAIQTMLSLAVATGADIVTQRSVCMTDAGQVLDETIPEADFDYRQVYNGQQACRLTIPGWTINMNGGLRRPAILRQAEQERRAYAIHQGFTQQLIYDDELLSRFILRNATLVAVSPVPYYRRLAPTSITRQYSIKQLDHLHVQRLVERLARQWYPELVPDAEMNLWHKVAGNTCEYEYHKKLLSPTDRAKANELISHYWHTMAYDIVRPSLPLWRRVVMTYSYRLFRAFIAIRCMVK